jgi:hypothetical protein
MNEAKLRGIDIDKLRTENGQPTTVNEAKLRGINLRALRFEGAPVDFRLTVEASKSVGQRKLDQEFTSRQFEIALAALEKETNV